MIRKNRCECTEIAVNVRNYFGCRACREHMRQLLAVVSKESEQRLQITAELQYWALAEHGHTAQQGCSQTFDRGGGAKGGNRKYCFKFILKLFIYSCTFLNH